VHAGSTGRPRLRGWLVATATVLVAFFLLIYSRIALDNSAFLLEDVSRQIELEEARYWELRLEVARLQDPDRITGLAEHMGMVYPEMINTVEVSGLGTSGGDADDRWVELKGLLSAQP
jgi:cell division protein FtsL